MCWGATGTVFLLGFLWGKGSQELGQWLEQGPGHWSSTLQGLQSQWKPGEEETVPWEDGWGGGHTVVLPVTAPAAGTGWVLSAQHD